MASEQISLACVFVSISFYVDLNIFIPNRLLPIFINHATSRT